MAYETIVAVFDSAAHAEAAVKALKAGGFADADISVFDEDRLASGKKAIASGVKEAGLWNRLFGDDLHQHEAAVYGQTVQHGGVVVRHVYLRARWPTPSPSSTCIAQLTCMIAR